MAKVSLELRERRNPLVTGPVQLIPSRFRNKIQANSDLRQEVKYWGLVTSEHAIAPFSRHPRFLM
jgi:hypothetical protein